MVQDREANGLTGGQALVAGMFNLDGIAGLEQYVLREEDGGWSVFYSERGARSRLREFRSEAEACADMLHRILSDQSWMRGVMS